MNETAAPFGHVLSMIGFVYSLMPDENETRMLIALGNVMCKLGAAIAEFDFRYDSAYVSGPTPDGAFESRVVKNYR